MQSIESTQYHGCLIDFNSTRLSCQGETMSIMIENTENDSFIVSVCLDHHFENFIFEFEYYKNPKYIRREIREEVYNYYEYKDVVFNKRRFERVLRCFSKLDHRSLLVSNVKSARKI